MCVCVCVCVKFDITCRVYADSMKPDNADALLGKAVSTFSVAITERVGNV